VSHSTFAGLWLKAELTDVKVYGRKLAVLTPYFLAGIFAFATAVSKDIQTVLITRFFAGFFGSAPVTNTGGVLGDIWTAEQRGVALVAYAMAVVSCPQAPTHEID
jgi:MFS family permease